MDLQPADLPITSSIAEEVFTPPGSPRSYTLSPMTYRERTAFRADHAREGGIYPTREQLIGVLRAAIEAAAPSNEAQLLAVLDAAEADPSGEDRATETALAVIEVQLSDDPGYAALVAARRRWSGMLPFCAARHALRGWSGPGLPPFRREKGAVPSEVMDLLPEDEVDAIGGRALALMRPSKAAEGNSAPLSPSPGSPAPTPEG